MRTMLGVVVVALVGCGHPTTPTTPTIPVVPASPAPTTWLATGQSNMEALTTPPLLASVRVEVRQFGVINADIPAWTPLMTAGPFSAVGGAFAADLADRLQRTVRLIAATRGGTPLAGWEPGGSVRDNLLGRLVGESINGVVFWQGESDALTYDAPTITSYGARLDAVIADWRVTFAQPTLPVVLVGLQRYCNNWPSDGTPQPTCTEPVEWTAIREAQRQVSLRVPHVAFIDASALTTGALHPTDAYAAIGRALAAKAVEIVRP